MSSPSRDSSNKKRRLDEDGEVHGEEFYSDPTGSYVNEDVDVEKLQRLLEPFTKEQLVDLLVKS